MSKQVRGFNYQKGAPFMVTSKEAKAMKSGVLSTGARRTVVNGDELFIASDGDVIFELWSKACLCSAEQKVYCVAQCGVRS